MKVICDRSALADAVNIVGGVVATRSPSPVLLCVKLTAKDGRLILEGTDLEVGLRLGVDQVDVQEEGVALVPADKLSQIVRASDDSTLTLETEDHAMHIRGEDSHFKVFGFDPSEAPAVRDFEGLEVNTELECGVFKTLISRTLFAAAAEHSRYAINGVLFDRDGRKLRLIATDGRRLALAKGTCVSGEGTVRTIIPVKALTLINKIIDDPEATVKIAIDESQILFKVGDGPDSAVLSSNLVEGAFPPFEDVIPKDQDKRVSFEAGVLSSAIRRAALLTNEESKGVRLSFNEHKLTLTSRAPEMGEAEIQIDLKDYSGDPVEIGFNPGFITDALKVVGNNDVIIELKASNKPGVIKIGTDFTYVIMPVNLQ
ncbi:MAG: DNA polymerase III subunit beta [Planctomycetota bacterium]|nr:DNA polymerase III subunit beta [Planctomycetota bacterium]